MSRALVIANETIGGRELIDKAKELKAEDPGLSIVVCVPRTNPRHGNIIYDAVGEVGDPDPYTAAMDAIREWRPDRVIVSTKPATVSGWLRRDLVERISEASGLPVDHVVVDVDQEGLPFKVTLVVANRTASSPQLLDRLRELHEEDASRLFIIAVPQEGGHGQHFLAARGRLGQTLDVLRREGVLAAGMVGDPDPYTATMQAVQFFRVDDVIISTLGPERSGWMRADLVERVKRASSCPVEHVEAKDEVAA
jgi:hypothetical protein